MRVKNQRLSSASRDYDRIEMAIRYLEENFQDQPELEEVATAVGLSPYHFHRLFSRWVGTTPKRFLQFLTVDYAKDRLRESSSVMEAAWDAGLSGSGRLHDLMVTVEANTSRVAQILSCGGASIPAPSATVSSASPIAGSVLSSF